MAEAKALVKNKFSKLAVFAAKEESPIQKALQEKDQEEPEVAAKPKSSWGWSGTLKTIKGYAGMGEPEKTSGNVEIQTQMKKL